ncbi:Cdc37 N terminal kinase binding-domain-containing protein [Nemania sp. FL0916]|nr:Cdc37 N terminal kinase binding-domain-containing protein [Nemania sp. FL0916]
MPVDYSKWDNLELSDDSDIEVHPNVDKRSFIRAKQNQIHAERQQRRHEITTLKYEHQINDGLISRLTTLIAFMRSSPPDAESSIAENALRAVLEIAGNPEGDKLPERPEGVHTQVKNPPLTYSRIITNMLDLVNEALNEGKIEHSYTSMVEELGNHLKKVQDLQKQLLARLAELEGEEGRKITSESIHTGFDSSYVAKSDPSTSSTSEKKSDDSKLELLNPNWSMKEPDPNKTATEELEEAELEVSEDGRKFANISSANLRESHAFMIAHPHIVTEKETDSILIMAFDTLIQNPFEFEKLSRNYVHQGLLLQYCRALGKDGVPLFFKRMTTPGHQAQGMFAKDVNETYSRIKTRALELHAKQKGGGVEQIQLQALEPGLELKIQIPPENSEDEAEKNARAIYETFSPDMRKALESGSLEQINEVLGNMEVPEAEEIVGLFSDVSQPCNSANKRFFFL